MIHPANLGMTWSSEIRRFIEAWESCVLTPYQDSRGVWTIGWGETGDHVDALAELPDARITQLEADEFLLKQLDTRTQRVLEMVTVPIEQQHLDSTLSFAYNLGVEALRGSSLLRFMNRGLFVEAGNEFPKWDNERKNGVLTPSTGLLKRRLGERAIFLYGDYSHRP